MKFSKLFAYLVIGLIASLITLLIYRQGFSFLASVDMKLKDERFNIRKNISPDNRVVIVAIDSKSVNELGRWPWKRSVIADLLNSLKAYRAKVAALDIVFSEPDTCDIKQDAVLAQSIKNNKNVILGYFYREEKEDVSPEALSQIESSKIKLIKIEEGVASIPVSERSFVETNIPVIGRSALDFGFFNTDPDSDGLIRKSTLLMLYKGDIYPSLVLKALRHYFEKEIVLEIASFGVSSLRIGQTVIPCDEGGRLTVNYYGKAGTVSTLSAVDVIKKRLKPESLKDKIVFVGATETGIYDMRATPVSSVYPGVEIHASVASNVLQNRYVLRDTRVIAVEIIWMALFPILLALMLGLLRNSSWALLAFIFTSSAYCVLNYLLFQKYSADMSLLYPLSSTALSYVGSEAYRNLVVEKKNRYLRKAFSSYVSPDLVNVILKNPERLALGGEKKEITVLFSDIRGFTTISERLAPDALVSLLNDYLGPMTTVVLKNNGTLDKYIGDAVMAIYNAPLDVPAHPEKACQTAIEMFEELENVNKRFEDRDMPRIDIGIGINTGFAVIGNMGADIRFDYTAIGDTVNLASRLEGQNKYYGTHIILSEFTAEKVKDIFMIRQIDLMRVVGKEKPVAIYELMTKHNPELKNKFTEAVSIYRSQKFHEAETIFNSLIKQFNDNVSKLYVERCQEYLNTPPASDWDGVFISKKK